MNTVGPVLLPEFLPTSVTHHDAGAGPEADGQGGDLTEQVDRLLNSDGDGLYKDIIAAVERYVLLRVLDRTQGNISQSAKKLGITRGSLRNKIHALGLSIDRQIKIDDSGADGDEGDVRE